MWLVYLLTIKIKHSRRWIYQFHRPYFFRLHVSRCIFDGIWYIKASPQNPKKKIIREFGFQLPLNQPTWPTDARSGVELPIFCHLIHQVQHHLPLPQGWDPWNQLRMPWVLDRKKPTRSNPETKKFPVGIFWLRKYIGAKKKFWGQRKIWKNMVKWFESI